MPQLLRSAEDKKKDLISLTDVLRECSRGKRHLSSKDEKLCNDGGETVSLLSEDSGICGLLPHA